MRHFCTNCGKLLVNTWKICAYCGVKIRKDLWAEKLEPEFGELETKNEETIPSTKIQETAAMQTTAEPDISLLKEDKTQLIPISREEMKIVPKDEVRIEQTVPIPSVEVKTKEKNEHILIPSQERTRIEKSIERFSTKPLAIDAEIIPKEKIEKPIATENLCPFCGYKNDLNKTHCYQCGYKLNK